MRWGGIKNMEIGESWFVDYLNLNFIISSGFLKYVGSDVDGCDKVTYIIGIDFIEVDDDVM